MKTTLQVGILSDTHGLLRPEARSRLLGSDYIVHGGDIGSADILEELSAIAPLIAVRGNNDTAPWASALRETELVRIGSVFLYVIHDVSQIDFDLAAARVRVVVSGHSHKPSIEERGGILYVNPGSCGPRRFKLPISMAVLDVVVDTGDTIQARIENLAGDGQVPGPPGSPGPRAHAGVTKR